MLATLLTIFHAFVSAQNSVKYHVTMNDVKYVYGVAEPVARLKPGDVLETNTVDAFGNAIQKPGDTLSLVKGDNPLTGPFYIETAEPGDTLAVKILDLQVDSNQGVGAFAPGFGALNETNYTPMVHPPLPEKIWLPWASKRVSLGAKCPMAVSKGVTFTTVLPARTVVKVNRSVGLAKLSVPW